MRTSGVTAAVAAWLAVGLFAAESALGNGGPFVVKYPNGDPAAKGVLARLDPSLKPARESRLRVLKEDLAIEFTPSPWGGKQALPPLATVTAAYTIENPTDEAVQVDFGFPILRGIYMPPMKMISQPDVKVSVDGKHTLAQVISNSVIYGIIRQRAREAIEKGIAAAANLSRLVAAVRGAGGASPAPAAEQQLQQAARQNQARQPAANDARPRDALLIHLVGSLNWNRRDAALMVEYADLDFGKMKSVPHDRWDHGFALPGDKDASGLLQSNLGPLTAIGEQKATQFFAQLASRFDKNAASAYQAIFEAWGGDVRERSVDLATGAIRPREINVDGSQPDKTVAASRVFGMPNDPTIFARVDYLDPNAKISDAEKASCRAVLKNLPVVFTFAPMNLLHYQVSFPPGAKQVVAITYKQYAYRDTRAPASYQLAYVLHPASLWDEFGPIHLKVRVPKGVVCRASVPMEKSGEVTSGGPAEAASKTLQVYQATLVEKKDRTGELFVALDKTGWDAQLNPAATKTAAVLKTAGAPLKK